MSYSHETILVAVLLAYLFTRDWGIECYAFKQQVYILPYFSERCCIRFFYFHPDEHERKQVPQVQNHSDLTIIEKMKLSSNFILRFVYRAEVKANTVLAANNICVPSFTCYARATNAVSSDFFLSKCHA